jgi:hypothetical protein
MNGAEAALGKEACVETGSFFCVAFEPQADCIFLHENLLSTEAMRVLPSGA